MAINLLPWREALARKNIEHDLLKLIFFLGALSLFLELGLGAIELTQYYLAKRIDRYQEQILAKKTQGDAAQLIQNQLADSKKKILQQKKLWGELIKTQETLTLILTTDKNIQISHLLFAKKAWEIEGKAKNMAVIEQYQKTLQAAHHQTQLKRWKPQPESAYFEMEIDA